MQEAPTSKNNNLQYHAGKQLMIMTITMTMRRIRTGALCRHPLMRGALQGTPIGCRREGIAGGYGHPGHPAAAPPRVDKRFATAGHRGQVDAMHLCGACKRRSMRRGLQTAPLIRMMLINTRRAVEYEC